MDKTGRACYTIYQQNLSSEFLPACRIAVFRHMKGVLVMDQNNMNGQMPVLRTEMGESLQRYTAKTFLWMFLGLLVTFAVSVVSYVTVLPYRILIISPYALFVLTGAELVLVLVLSMKVHSLSVGAARGLFLAYAVLNGVVFSTWFFLYELYSLVLVFAVTALYFGVMAAFGYFTSMDLSRIRTILIGGLIFLIAFNLLALFIPAFGAMERIVCVIGIVVFLAFTAYDTQKIKAFYYGFAGYEDMLSKASIISALELYLDFINLFLYLLRFLGKRKN